MKEYKWMTRAERKDFAKEMLIAGVLFGIGCLAWQVGPQGLIWLARLVATLWSLKVVIGLIKDRGKSSYLLLTSPIVLIVLFSEHMAAFSAFACFIWSPLILMGHALLTPLSKLLNNFTLWRGL